MLINRKSFEAVANEILSSEVFVFLFGIIDLGLGLALVLTHNLWVGDWRVIITVLGWLMVARGAVRMLIPAQVKEFGKKLVKNQSAMTTSFAVVLVLLGIKLLEVPFATLIIEVGLGAAVLALAFFAVRAARVRYLAPATD